MAGRRGVPPELRNALSSLIRTTIDQVGVVTEAAKRQAQTQKGRIDEALVARKRRERLAELGEIVLARIDAGELAELQLDPEIGALLEALAELDQELAGAGEPTTDSSPARWDRSKRSNGFRPAVDDDELAASDRFEDAEELAEYMNDDDVPPQR